MFDSTNYNTFDSNKLSIWISSDNLFYVNRYKIYYDAKELRIQPFNYKITEFVDKYNQKQLKLTCHESTFNKFIRKVERAINSILEQRGLNKIKLIYKNDMYIHILHELPLGKTIEFSIPAINVNKQNNVSCRLIMIWFPVFKRFWFSDFHFDLQKKNEIAFMKIVSQ